MARYQFLNLNPLGKKEQDCVIRAISLGLEEDYFIIEDKLKLVKKSKMIEELNCGEDGLILKEAPADSFQFDFD